MSEKLQGAYATVGALMTDNELHEVMALIERWQPARIVYALKAEVVA